jgi:hypothetical protein
MPARPAEPTRRNKPAPRVVVTGEVKAGKSSLINALLGASALATGPVERSALPILVSYAARPSLVLERSDRRRIPIDAFPAAEADDAKRVRLGLPIDLLKACRLLETPGFASGYDDLDRRAQAACRSAQAAIWCTPAVQAWKASEREAWLALPARVRQRSILAVTYKDAIASDADARHLSARLRAEAGPHFGRIIMVASREAGLGGRQSGACELRSAVLDLVAAFAERI